ncbi:MAG TPA: hypothetical protein VHG29_11640 [Novosphingobium sp.]|nr:hypothetical protein [Novosphingobium sp.]
MSRIAPTSAVSPKMYRHFAVITIAITACIGLFADGEGTEGLQAQIKARQSRNDLLTAEAGKLGARHVSAGKLHLRDEKRSYLAFAPDEGSDVRNHDGTVNFDDGDDSIAGPQNIGAPGYGPGIGGPSTLADLPPVLPPGVSAAEREKVELAQRQARRAPPVARPTAAQMEAMLAASRARSGNSGND